MKALLKKLQESLIKVSKQIASVEEEVPHLEKRIRKILRKLSSMEITPKMLTEIRIPKTIKKLRKVWKAENRAEAEKLVAKWLKAWRAKGSTQCKTESSPRPEKSSSSSSKNEIHCPLDFKQGEPVWKEGKGKVPSLQEICSHMLKRRIQSVKHLARMPSNLLLWILDECPAEHLERLENYNSWIREDTKVFWEKHCREKFPSGNYVNVVNWKERYMLEKKKNDAMIVKQQKFLLEYQQKRLADKHSRMARMQLTLAEQKALDNRNRKRRRSGSRPGGKRPKTGKLMKMIGMKSWSR
mmetsp:Transcript_730/g.993  ORF Transcript_730/g.993 Transcript_730/m.993 type:complete len:297 (+) Transcript_730:93-983(+)